MTAVFRAIMTLTANRLASPVTPSAPPAAAGSLVAPSTEAIYPDTSGIGGTLTTFDDPTTFSVAAFESAIEAGDTIAFGAGTFDVSGISAPVVPTSGCRIYGAGKGATTLVGGFSPSDLTNSSNDMFAILTGAFVLEDLAIESVRCVAYIRGTGSGDGQGGQHDRGAMFGLVDGKVDKNTVGDLFDDGIYFKNVRIQYCGRALYSAWLGQLDNLWWHNCDLYDLWHCIHSRLRGPANNLYFYNCHWLRNIIPPSAADPADSGTAYTDPAWVGTAACIHLGNKGGDNANDGSENITGQSPKGFNVRFEHCTFDTIASKSTPPEGDAGQFNRVSVLWATNMADGETGGNWFKRCKILNLGYDEAGNTTNTNRSPTIAYTKGSKVLWEKVHVEKVCVGFDGLWMNKGYNNIRWDMGTSDFRDIYIKDVLEGPSQPIAGAEWVGNLFGPHPKDFFAINLYAENLDTRMGLVQANGYPNDNTYASGTHEHRNWTIKNWTLRGNGYAIQIPGTGNQIAWPTIIVENMRFEGVNHETAGSDLDILQLRGGGSVGDIAGISIKRIWCDLTGSNLDTVTGLRTNTRPGSITADRAVEINGTGVTINRIDDAGGNVGGDLTGVDTSLADGDVTGADLTWMSTSTIGCDPVRG